jgi:hypothetical protein
MPRSGSKKLLAMSLRLLAVAEPGGYVRTFADEGTAMRDLLSEVFKVRQRSGLEAANRVEGRYPAKILAALPRDATAQFARGPLDEPPSQRELEVLALIAAGETNGGIANRLFVSTSTDACAATYQDSGSTDGHEGARRDPYPGSFKAVLRLVKTAKTVVRPARGPAS